jgi:hypothetical protein
MRFKLSPKKLNLDPCPDCPVPTNFIVKPLPAKEEGCTRYGIECRECGDNWIEVVDEQ